MQSYQRVITGLPLDDLWDDAGPLPAARQKDLSASQLRELLRQGPVRFVVAEVGARPRWIPESGCFDFWKHEVQSHLAEPDRGAYLSSFEGAYCYFATEWRDERGSTIVVLQVAH